ncbi:MAG: MucR family transcriptional regulator [Propionibacteriaceae bacterium]|nr:MucR family transcriptional regulator [Propionibacteriaceae bacterium]
MHQLHEDVGTAPSGFGLLGVVERDETGVLCHECGHWFGSLASHIPGRHGMSVAEYRQRHQLPAQTPLVSLGTSRLISQQSRDRVGTAGWKRFETARDENLPAAVEAAKLASSQATAGAKAAIAAAATRARASSPVVADDELWEQRLGEYLTWWSSTGVPPSARPGASEEATRLGRWMRKQWQAIAAGSLSQYRRECLEQAGIPLRPGRGARWWRTTPPPSTSTSSSM